MNTIRLSAIIIFILSLGHITGQESPRVFDEFEVGVVEQLGEYIPEGIMLINETDSLVSLLSLIDKPTVLTFIYFRCPGVCTPLMNGLAEVVDKTDLTAGTDYQIITISFDPSETQEIARKKKGNYLQLIDRAMAADGWRFYVADSVNIAKATSATGFRYKPQGNDFIHSATLIFISPQAKITRYLNGTYFLPFDFKMAIVEAGKGKVGPTINKFMQYCFSYDTSGQRYVLNITKIAGTLILFLGVIIFIFLLISGRRKKSQY